MNLIKSLWAQEPVRVAVYSALVVLAGLLVAQGVVSGDQSSLILAVVAVALGVPATEIARSKVTPQ